MMPEIAFYYDALFHGNGQLTVKSKKGIAIPVTGRGGP
jgi:hypothetical protein